MVTIKITQTAATKMMAPPVSTALSRLCDANLGILSQKLGLLSSLTTKHGNEKALEVFQTTCPIVKASIGQHFRHSLDHIELIANIAEKAQMGGSAEAPELHYDLRERGCSSEHDMEVASERIINVINKLEVVSIMDGQQQQQQQQQVIPKQEFPVQACFMLSGDSEDPEFALTSSIGRELGFAAHHAIHHMAMVKIIATQTAGLSETDLPNGFGKAPSTIRFDNQ